MDYTFQIRKLSIKFYKNHPYEEYPDILRKQNRAYGTLLIAVCAEYYIYIPFRSEIHHPYAFKFQNSRRSQHSHSGLDYTKICIINRTDYLDSAGVVDHDEYIELRNHKDQIIREAVDYVNSYIRHIKGLDQMSKKQYRQKYWYSTLKYFHHELGLPDTQSE